eukprot:CAMPEP_0114543404 /NCGR_PEP_ID=MMETSP0114-20121206/2336_1 /TAXON_ID=31324 /ORGANISM="Goniomonas sp, Strain m" /LENGTH=108 /DNA_ID=CAMNT_0001727737 /DNA_START=70 /DNA_END=393 /DNA_ORIENTATION=-
MANEETGNYKDCFCEIRRDVAEPVLVIYNYYFPFGSKTVRLADIETIEDYTEKYVVFADKSWGMGITSIWWAREIARWRRKHPLVVLKVRGDSLLKGFSTLDATAVVR